MSCASANGNIPLEPIPAASVAAVLRITAVMLFPKVEMML
jgi:hypothetical protein